MTRRQAMSVNAVGFEVQSRDGTGAVPYNVNVIDEIFRFTYNGRDGFCADEKFRRCTLWVMT